MYLKLLNAPPQQNCLSKCSEPASTYMMITERHIQAMWLEQKYFKNLRTTKGHLIEVLSPGVWNAEAGPDFLKAHLKIDGAELLGDVEIHLSDESWYGHNHHKDPAYDRVVLHVGYWTPKLPIAITTSTGFSVGCTHIEKYLTVPESRLLKLIDLDLYPYHRFSGSGRCAGELFGKLPVQKTVELLSSAALWRLRQKWMHMEAKIGSGNVLVGGIAGTLGYKHNGGPFLELYKLLEGQKFKDEQEAFLEALAMCGFFGQPYRKRWFLSPYYQRLAAMYDSSDKPRPHIQLKFDHIRPANHPVRRLAFMAALLARREELQLLPRMVEQLWVGAWEGDRDWKVLKEGLIDSIPHYESEYWVRHYAFEAEQQPKAIAWIGDELKKEMVINIIMPFLFHGISHRGNSEEIAAFANFFASLHATKAKKTSYLTHRFFGDDKKEALMSRADVQQGAYQVHKDFCVHYEASCQGCPFVAKYHASADPSNFFHH